MVIVEAGKDMQIGHTLLSPDTKHQAEGRQDWSAEGGAAGILKTQVKG